MNQTLRQDADRIVRSAIARVMPEEAVRRALEGQDFGPGRLILVSAGKAGWSMGKAAWDCLGDKIAKGIVITKHGHAKGAIGHLLVREAGHPVPHNETFSATAEAVRATLSS